MALSFKDLEVKDKISYILCVASFLCGAVLTFLGVFLSPVGVIDTSILTSLGVFLSFSGAIIGINTHYSTELNNFKSKVEYEINDRERKIKEKEKTDEQ